MSALYVIAGTPPPTLPPAAFVAIDAEDRRRVVFLFDESVEPARRQALAARLHRLWTEFLETALEAVGATDEDGEPIALRPRGERWRCDGPNCAAITTDREADGWLVEGAADFCPTCQDETGPCEEWCPFCSGESCAQHGPDGCECDAVSRHRPARQEPL